MMRAFLFLAAAAALAGCGERPQLMTNGVRQDSQAFQGPGTVFTVPGWKVGDKTSWDSELRTRAQNTQNEYSKVN